MIFWGGFNANDRTYPENGGRFFPYLNLFVKP